MAWREGRGEGHGRSGIISSISFGLGPLKMENGGGERGFGRRLAAKRGKGGKGNAACLRPFWTALGSLSEYAPHSFPSSYFAQSTNHHCPRLKYYYGTQNDDGKFRQKWLPFNVNFITVRWPFLMKFCLLLVHKMPSPTLPFYLPKALASIRNYVQNWWYYSLHIQGKFLHPKRWPLLMKFCLLLVHRMPSPNSYFLFAESSRHGNYRHKN